MEKKSASSLSGPDEGTLIAGDRPATRGETVVAVCRVLQAARDRGELTADGVGQTAADRTAGCGDQVGVAAAYRTVHGTYRVARTTANCAALCHHRIGRAPGNSSLGSIYDVGHAAADGGEVTGGAILVAAGYRSVLATVCVADDVLQASPIVAYMLAAPVPAALSPPPAMVA